MKKKIVFIGNANLKMQMEKQLLKLFMQKQQGKLLNMLTKWVLE